MRIRALDPGLLTLVAIAAGTVYETSVAVGAVRVGPLNGSEPPGRVPVFVLAELALLIAALRAAAVTRAGSAGHASVIAPLAAAAFLVARYLSFDAYYAPSQRRMSDDGLVSPGVVVGLVAGCVAVALMLRLRTPSASRLASMMLLLVAATAWVTDAGH